MKIEIFNASSLIFQDLKVDQHLEMKNFVNFDVID